jgi:hypothetical protein
MSPSHPVRASDGYYYALMELFPSILKPEGGLCVMRTDNLNDPARWRAWDGSGFKLRMTNPYLTGEPALPCKYLDTELGVGYVVYNTYLTRYIQVTRAAQWLDGRLVCGIFYALSADLIHWSKLQLIAEGILSEWGGCDSNPQSPGVLEPVAVGYPSIIDHDDTTVNFERAGRTGHLYYVRFNQGAFDRDLVRVPLTFTRQD